MNWRLTAQIVLAVLGVWALGAGMDAVWSGSGLIPIGAALIFAAWALRRRP